ncbi:MAG: DsrE family protein [Saprospiraceae bacterium]|nr:DsrE family protein [Lewinella sp.]
MFRFIPLFLLFLSSLTQGAIAQNGKQIKGPVIEDFGSTFEVNDPDFKVRTDQVYKVVFDIHDTPDDPSTVNPMIGTLARFLNMHVHAGVSLENLKVVGVIHNKAAKDAMNNEMYRNKFGVDNPNIPLMEALSEAGAEIYLCGQSMYGRGLDPERLAGPVQTALSAMTVFTTLQQEGYTLIWF